jgi:transposase-like protein
MSKTTYSAEFKNQILLKAMTRGKQTLPAFASEHGLILSTLKLWMTQSRKKTALNTSALPEGLEPAKWDAAQRLLALNQTYGLSEQERSAWCRTHGLFEHHLSAWQQQFCSSQSSTSTDSTQSKAALRELQNKYQDMQRDLLRKDRALAETAALLVLQKKFQALLQDADK